MHRYPGKSSAVANATASPPSVINVRHNDHQSLHQGPEPKQRWIKPSLSDHLNKKQHPTRPQPERRRPDPPEYFADRQPLQHTLEIYGSKPRPSNQSQTPPKKQWDHGLNLLPLSNQWKPNKAKQDQAYSHKQHQERHQRHRERERCSGQSTRERRTNTRGKKSSSRPQKSHQASSQTEVPRHRAEDRDDLHWQHNGYHPAKSSSFQVRPSQLLQVYKDLHEKQVESNKNQGKVAGESNSNYIVERKSGENLEEFERLDESTGSNEYSIMESLGTCHGQTSRRHDDESEGDSTHLLSDGSDTNSLTVIHGECNSSRDDDSYDGTHPTKDKFKIIKPPHRKSSMSGGNTSITTTSTTTTSGVTDMVANDLEVEVRLRQKQRQHGDIICSDHSDNGNEYYAIAAAATKKREETRVQGRIGHPPRRGRSHSNNATSLARSIEFPPTFTKPIDEQLLQKQIKYLEHKEPLTGTSSNRSTNQDSRQLIVYPCRPRPPTMQEASFKEVRRRREIVHGRKSARKNYDILLNHGNGKRWSF